MLYTDKREKFAELRAKAEETIDRLFPDEDDLRRRLQPMLEEIVGWRVLSHVNPSKPGTASGFCEPTGSERLFIQRVIKVITSHQPAKQAGTRSPNSGRRRDSCHTFTILAMLEDPAARLIDESMM
eukprot:GHVU01155119.1.p1 GENE.GHVU01155119.1~~GHVU01155119.1.p1  ORF type:complete len:126 (-),score=14.71 GHVU01155119.1:225-602(-)